MPRLAGLELSLWSLISRLVLGVALSAIAFIAFCLTPASFTTLISNFVPVTMRDSAAGVLSSLVNPTLPHLGLTVTVLTFLSIVFGGSKVHGPILVLEGLCLSAYTCLIFQGGKISVTLSEELLHGLSANLRVDLTTLMLLFLVSPVLTVAKGLILVLKK